MITQTVSKRKARLATVIPPQLDVAIRQRALDAGTGISTVVSAYLAYAEAHRDDPELIELLEEEITQLREQRSHQGALAIRARYGKAGD